MFRFMMNIVIMSCFDYYRKQNNKIENDMELENNIASY